MDFVEGADTTTLKLKQTGVPRSEEHEIKENWERQIFNRVKHIFGYML